jgi:hypothetical protein
MDKLILFRCPYTALTVQTSIPRPGAGSEEGSYEAVNCPACTRLHFVHPATGKVLGDEP